MTENQALQSTHTMNGSIGAALKKCYQEVNMHTISLPTKRPFNWKVFLFVLALMVPATYAVVPYTLTLVSITLKPAELLLFLILQLVNVLIYGVLAGMGLFLAARVGLGLPFIEGWLKKEPIWDRFRGVLIVSLASGVAVGLIVIILQKLVFGPPIQATLDSLGIVIPESVLPPAWQGFLASFKGGIVEEVQFRLFGLTLLVWLGSLARRDSAGRPTPLVFWIANIIFAVIFGLIHLPNATAVGLPLNALIVTSTLVLNGLAGLVFGWLYWKWGLESAMIAHFATDIVLHVLLVLAQSVLR